MSRGLLIHHGTDYNIVFHHIRLVFLGGLQSQAINAVDIGSISKSTAWYLDGVEFFTCTCFLKIVSAMKKVKSLCINTNIRKSTNVSFNK